MTTNRSEKTLSLGAMVEKLFDQIEVAPAYAGRLAPAINQGFVSRLAA